MALHCGGHLELKKMHKGDFWGLFGIRLGRCPCIIPEKISFLQFYSRFNPNALALVVQWLELRAQSREVVGSHPTSDMMVIFLRPAQTQGELGTGSMGRSSH